MIDMGEKDLNLRKESREMRRLAWTAAVCAVAFGGATSAFGGLLYEPSSYAAQGNILLQLDGIRNVGALKAHDGTAETWRDISSSGNVLTFEDAHATASVTSEWTSDGYVFGGGAYGKLTNTVNVGSAFTVQVVCDVDVSAQKSTWPSYFGAANDKCNFYTSGTGRTFYFKTDGKAGRVENVNWDGRYITGLYDKTKAVVFQTASGTVAAGTNTASIGAQTYCIGSVYKASDAEYAVKRYLNGTIKAVRVYNKVLSTAELEANRAIDEARFFNGMPVTNVIVATAVPGLEGNESSGVYAFDAEGYTFGAPHEQAKDGVVYACAGYTLETWNGSSWSAPVSYASCSYPATDMSAKVRLTWQWLRAPGVASADLDPLFGDYVTDGLVLHLDGIRNAGADAPHEVAPDTWIDLAGGKRATFFHDYADGSEWRNDGYFFGGKSVAQVAGQLTGLTNVVTVQIVCDADPPSLKQTVSWPNLMGCNNNDTCNVYYNTGGNLTFKNATGGNVVMGNWEGRYATAIRDGTTNYIFQTASIANAVKIATTQGNIGNATVYVGSVGSTLDKRKDRWFTGTIKAVRIYNRVLTDEELAQNRAIDEVRFFGAAMPVTNVIVASSVRGVAGGEPEGAYALSAGGHTFTASVEAVGHYLVEGTYTFTAEDAVADGKTRRVTGYKLETWDAGTGDWGAPTFHSGAYFTYTEGAKVRLTWQWAGEGTMLLFR